MSAATYGPVHKVSGPWNDEPDFYEFSAYGFLCRIERMPLGHFWARIGLPKDHPLYGASSSDPRVKSLSAHNGISYPRDTDVRDKNEMKQYIEVDGLWWIGFDACRAGTDYVPGLTPDLGDKDTLYRPYRTLEFMKDECERLALQLFAIAFSVSEQALKGMKAVAEHSSSHSKDRQIPDLSSVASLLSSLMHLCTEQGIDFISAKRLAEINYHIEKKEMSREPKVFADIHSDDSVFRIEAKDVTEFFSQATDKQILDLAFASWGGDYPTDDVALFFEDKDPEIRDMMKYLDAIQGSGNIVGFECYVDQSSAMKWLKVHRPRLWGILQGEGYDAD